MIPDQIEKEILIEAPVEVVWDLVSIPEHLGEWFMDRAEIDVRVGGRGALTVHGTETYELLVEALEPPRRFAFRWIGKPGALKTDNSLLVEFILEPVGANTRLRVVESGFDRIDWADEDKARYVDDHSSGWPVILGRLRARATSIRR